MNHKVGILLLNLGTPESATTPSVRRYLREFLSDQRVIDIPRFFRWCLLNFIILPFRSPRSAEAYQKIWTPQGSPLLVNSLALKDAVAKSLGDKAVVEFAMRYGRPHIEDAYERFLKAGVSKVVVLPLYPQYSASATGSCLEKVYEVFGKSWNVLPLEVVPPFYADGGFIEAFADLGNKVLKEMDPHHVVFSFHGLPERHILKSDPTGSWCLAQTDCCSFEEGARRHCYRAQCFQTATLIAQKCGLKEGSYTVAFQSRLGRTPWIKPYTDVLLDELAKKGVQRVAVFSPAFVADCLETLEEIEIRAKETYEKGSDRQLRLVPSLNSSTRWVRAVCDLLSKHLNS